MTAERAVLKSDWPVPSWVPEPRIVADETRLFLRYHTDRGVALIKFPLVKSFKHGAPNEEALAGHPLYGKGLEFRGVHKVENSSWINSLEQQNSVHPKHERGAFLEGTVHYIFTFQDSTLECVVNEGKWWKPEIRVCEPKEANELWRQLIHEMDGS
jgi:hypothetical protein